MLTNARQILVSELVLARGERAETVEGEIDEKITNSFKTFRVGQNLENEGVNKFIPFDSSNDTIA